MKYFVIPVIFGLFLILLFSFQISTPLKTIVELREVADKLAYNEQFDSAAFYYEKARKLAKEKKMDEELILILKKELILWTARTDLDIPPKRKKIALYWNEFQATPRFRQYFYDAQSSFFLYEMKLDSFQVYAEKTLAEIAINKDWDFEVNFYTFLAQQFLHADDFVSAFKYLKKAEISLQKCIDPKDIGLLDFYYVCNEIYNLHGEYELALKYSLICLELEFKTNSYKYQNLKTAFVNVAVNYNELGDFENGLKYYNEALKIQLKTNEVYEASILYENMGGCYLSLNRFDEAYEFFKKAVELSQKEEEPIVMNQISVYRSMADFLIKTNRTDSAIIFVEDLLEFQKNTKRSLDRSYEVIGRVYTKAGEFKKARYYYEKAVQIVNQKFEKKNYRTSNVYYSFAGLCLAEGKLKEGLGHIQKAIYANTTEEIDSVNYRSNPDPKFVNNKELMMNGLRLKSIILDSMRVNKIDQISAVDIFAVSKVTSDLLLHISQTVNYRSKLVWLNKKAHTYFQHAIYYSILAAEETKEEKYKEEAFLISERSKSILLYESLKEKTSNKFGTVPDSLLLRENRLKKFANLVERKKRDAIVENDSQAILSFEKDLLEIQQEIDIIAYIIKKDYPDYHKLKFQLLNIKPKDVMSKLDDKTITLEYFQGKNRSFVFVLRKNDFECHQVIADSTVTNSVLDFQKLVADLPYAINSPEEYFRKYSNAALEQYNLWLKPYLKAEDKSKRLVIIADGTLSYLPFEALLTKEAEISKDPNYAKLPYLLNDYTLNYDYSAQLWLEHKEPRKQLNGKILAMGPSKKIESKDTSSITIQNTNKKELRLRSDAKDLPGAEKEILALKNEYQGKYYDKFEASEKNWKKEAKDYGILHFAMHGLLDENEPEFSSLMFSDNGDKEEDNFLCAYEIKESKLNASLAVLSACETGAGKYQRGEGVVSLGRGFMYAGVPSVVMTLWKLNDQSATELISDFYANLQAGQQKDKALRNAKIKYLEKSNGMSAHPALWACFIQLGDYSPIFLAQKSYFNYLIISAVIGSVIVLLLFFYRRKNKKATA